MTVFSKIQAFHGVRESNQMINISLKDRYVWFVNPKVASSTLSASLQRLEIRQTPAVKIRPHPELESAVHIKPYQLPQGRLQQLLTEKEMIKFVFVRNPFRRLASAYLDKIVNNRPEKSNILELLNARKPFSLDADISFDHFIGAICDAKPKQLDPHWKPQIYTTGSHWVQHNFVGKFENFEGDLMHLQRLLQVDLMAHYNSFVPHKTNAEEKYKDLFRDKSLQDKVTEYFKSDFEAFGYSGDVE